MKLMFLAIALLITGCDAGMSCQCSKSSEECQTWSGDAGALQLSPERRKEAIGWCHGWCAEVRQ